MIDWFARLKSSMKIGMTWLVKFYLSTLSQQFEGDRFFNTHLYCSQAASPVSSAMSFTIMSWSASFCWGMAFILHYNLIQILLHFLTFQSKSEKNTYRINYNFILFLFLLLQDFIFTLFVSGLVEKLNVPNSVSPFLVRSTNRELPFSSVFQKGFTLK